MQRSHQDIAIDSNLISAKAYEIWQTMGCPEGVAEKTWFEAERQLRTNAEAQSVNSRTEPVSEPALKAHSPKSEPAPVRTHDERDSATLATGPNKAKKLASGGKRNQR
jgi:hypothetical protein